MSRTLRLIALGFSIGVGSAFALGMALRQDEPAPAVNQSAMAMLQSMQQAHDNPTAPSSFHKKLEHFIGKWNVTVRLWAMGPDQPAAETKGTAAMKWMLGGRFINEEFKGNLEMGGMQLPLDSVSITGYDNYRNQYVGALFGSMSTEMIPYHGSVSLDGKTFNYYGTMHEPMLDVAGRVVRFRTQITDENSHTVTVYDLMAGENHKAVEFVYERAE